MALQKDITMPQGNIASYHKVLSVDITKGSCLVGHFVDQNTRIEGKAPFVTDFQLNKLVPTIPAEGQEPDMVPLDWFTNEELLKEGNSPIVIAYKALKTLPEFNEAIDV